MSSTGLLFLTYFIALRAPLTVDAVCLMYYEHKAKVEDGLLVETYRDGYTEYMNSINFFSNVTGATPI